MQLVVSEVKRVQTGPIQRHLSRSSDATALGAARSATATPVFVGGCAAPDQRR
jgi:hypothetical protein